MKLSFFQTWEWNLRYPFSIFALIVLSGKYAASLQEVYDSLQHSQIDRPNVIILMPDDMPLKWPEAPEPPPGKQLKDIADTPHLDRLRSESIIFKKAYVSGPKCAPSRFNLLTMKYCSRSIFARFHTLQQELQSPSENFDFRTTVSVKACKISSTDNQENLQTILHSAGYMTIHSGKWHLGDDEKWSWDDYDGTVNLVRKAGFSEVASVYGGNLKAGLNFSHNMEWQLSTALEKIEKAQSQGQPFFLYFAPTLPNGGDVYKDALLNFDIKDTPAGRLDNPPTVSRMESREFIWSKAVNTTIEQGKPENGNIAGMIWLDSAIGALYSYLEDKGILNRTLILITMDHGMTEKATLYEGGARVVQFVRYPPLLEAYFSKMKNSNKETLIAGDVCGVNNFLTSTAPEGLPVYYHNPVSNVDIGPSILDILGIENVTFTIDGNSWARPFLDDSLISSIENCSPKYLEMNKDRALVTNDFKFISRSLSTFSNNTIDQGLHLHPIDFYEMYDLNSDEQEQFNIANSIENGNLLELFQRLICLKDISTSLINETLMCPFLSENFNHHQPTHTCSV